ncbi:hypothetical protein TIFTF001_042264, partial [Ficus carica]
SGDLLWRFKPDSGGKERCGWVAAR